MVYVQNLIDGVLLGGFYSIIAIGFSLVWGVLNLVNLAHGAFVMMGAYIAYSLFTHFGMDPFLSIPIVMSITFLLGYVIQLKIMNRVMRAQIFMLIILTFGLDILMINIFKAIYTANVCSITTSYSGMFISIGSVVIHMVRLIMFIIAGLLTIALHFFLNKTKTGNAIRATGLNKDAAKLIGVDIRRTYAITFALSAGIAGAAGAMLSSVGSITPFMGTPFTFIAATIACLGGLGSIPGVIVAGVIYGLTETFAAQLFSPAYKIFFGFVLLLGVLIFRPEGMMGKKFFAEIKH